MSDQQAPRNEWKDAVIDACVLNWIAWDDSDPRGTLHDVISHEQSIALDPLVSKDARELINRGLEEAAQLVEDFLPLWWNLFKDNPEGLAQFMATSLRDRKEE